MKNISRRVFIKGLAVAGVAAAASTVLAGCNTNMIPGVDDGNEDPSEEPSTNSNTLTFADPADASKTVSITLSNMVVDTSLAANHVLKFDAKVVNNKIGNVVFAKDAYAGSTATEVEANDYYVVLSAFPDGKEGNKNITAVAGTSALYVDNVIVASTASGADVFCTANDSTGTVTEDGYVYLAVDKDLDWSKVTVQMKVYKILSTTTAGVTLPLDALKFTFSK